eukprot:CAMPEP_0119327798 /NCGR_PEP_ID=MMETSP1333-20130426/71714_1 /TAXON_ID=418940 /ORGANISM="Scyphosphaera apsteinii, Strain RCC1455" /LENGTH=68 /DNA_ID=CAMNT_0007336497 /DNA_START=437 /DNA_END=640 /DNA_ORIENTATION=+
MRRMNEAFDTITWREVVDVGSKRSIPQRLLDDVVDDCWRALVVQPFVWGEPPPTAADAEGDQANCREA